MGSAESTHKNPHVGKLPSRVAVARLHALVKKDSWELKQAAALIESCWILPNEGVDSPLGIQVQVITKALMGRSLTLLSRLLAHKIPFTYIVIPDERHDCKFIACLLVAHGIESVFDDRNVLKFPIESIETFKEIAAKAKEGNCSMKNIVDTMRPIKCLLCGSRAPLPEGGTRCEVCGECSTVGCTNYCMEGTQCDRCVGGRNFLEFFKGFAHKLSDYEVAQQKILNPQLATNYGTWA